MDEKRHKEMERLHKKYFPYFQKAIKQHAPKDLNFDVKEMLDAFVIGSIGKNIGIRAFIFYNLSKMKFKIKEDLLYKLCAAIEIQLAQMYCFNVGADKKGPYKNKQKSCFECAKIVKKINKDFIYDMELSQTQKNKIWEIFNLVYESFYIGQTFDTLINLYKNLGLSVNTILKNPLKFNDEKFFWKYGFEKKCAERVNKQLGSIQFDLSNLELILWLRTYGINAAMIEGFAKILHVISKSKNKLFSISNYGLSYGMSMMIINDIQDFSLDMVKENKGTREKERTDVFNDVLQNKITWPIFYCLKKYEYQSNKIISQGYLSRDFNSLEKLREFLVIDGAMTRSVVEAVAYCNLGLNEIEKENEGNAKKMLQDIIVSISKNSKYLVFLKNKYNKNIKVQKSIANLRKRNLFLWISKNRKLISNIYEISNVLSK